MVSHTIWHHMNGMEQANHQKKNQIFVFLFVFLLCLVLRWLYYSINPGCAEVFLCCLDQPSAMGVVQGSIYQ